MEGEVHGPGVLCLIGHWLLFILSLSGLELAPFLEPKPSFFWDVRGCCF